MKTVCVDISKKDAGWLHDYLRAHLNFMLLGQKEKTRRILKALVEAGVESSIYNHYENLNIDFDLDHVPLRDD